MRYSITKSKKLGKDPVGSKRIGDVEVTNDDCIFRQDLLNETVLVRTVMEVFEIKTLCLGDSIDLHVLNTECDFVKL